MYLCTSVSLKNARRVLCNLCTSVSLNFPRPRAGVFSLCSFYDKRTKETKALVIEKYVLMFFCLIIKHQAGLL